MSEYPEESLTQALHEELVALRTLIGEGPPDQAGPLHAAAEKLSVALEELHVAEEELRQQNDELQATYDALAAERRRYQDLYELAPDGYLVTDLQGVIREANRAAGALLGLPPEQLSGKPLAVFVPRDGEREFRTRLSRMTQAARPERWDLPLLRHRGRPFIAGVTAALSRHAAGEPPALRWLLRDVTNEKRLEEDTRQSETRFRSTFETAAVGMAHLSLEGRFLRVNDRFCEITGYPREELLERTFQDITHPADLDDSLRQHKRLRCGEIDRYAAEKRYLRRDGSVVWAQLHASLMRDGAGEPLCHVAVVQNITERKRMEVELRDNELRLQTLADSMPQLVWTARPGGAVDYLNTRLQEYTAISRSEDGLWDWPSLLHPEDRESTERAWEEAARGRGVYQIEHRVRLRGGAYRWHLTRAVPLCDRQGRVVKWFGTSTDIDALKEVEEQLRHARDAAEAATEAKSQFVANMSHEIRTPLAGVLGMTEVLDGTMLDPEQRECVDAIRLSGKLLLGIVNDILDLSRIEIAGVRLESVRFALCSAIEDTVHLQAEVAHAKGLELCCRVGRDVPAQVVGDPGRLRQVLFNLVGNAVKFTERGQVVVRADAEVAGGETARLRVEVEDTGIGIPEAARAQLFQTFTQGDASTTRRYGGSGLGLAIAKRLVEAMGGEIGLRSAPDEGSTFWFTVPFAVATGVQEVPAAPDLAGSRALVVVPHPTSREILVEQLVRMGGEAVGAANRAEALRLWKSARAESRPFRLALVDLDLPDGGGLALARELEDKGNAAAPGTILLAPFTSRGPAAKAQEEDGFCFLVKPVRERELGRCAEAVLKGRRPAAAPEAPHAFAEAMGESRGRVLLAEDNPVVQLVMSRFLERLGFRVDVVEDGALAVERALANAYALVLMDWQMPGLDGLEAAREIRRREDPERRAPIVALTAHALAEHRDQCLAAGMDDFLSKPVAFEDLARMVEKWTTRAEEGSTGETTTGGFDRVAERLSEFEGRLGREGTWRIVDLFLEQGPERLAALRAAAGRGDAAAAAREAHQFRSTCCHLGTQRILEAAGSLERRAEAGDLKGAEAQLGALAAEWEGLREFLNARRSGGGG